MESPAKPSRLKLLWGVIPLIAIAELLVQWRIPTWEPSEDEWKEAARAIEAEKTAEDLVVIAPDWAVQGRVHLGHLMTLEDFGRFDTTRYERVYEVSAGGTRAPEVEGLEAESTLEFGRLTVSRHRLPARAEVLYDFVARSREGRMAGTRRQSPRIVIDHWFFPRLSIPMRLHRKPGSITFEQVPLGDVVRGYGIIGYRSGRFGKGGPVQLSVYLDGEKLGTHAVRNFGPREPFVFELPDREEGTFRFEVAARDGLEREFAFAADVRRLGEGDR